MSPSVLSADQRRQERARIWAGVTRKSTGVEVVLLSVFGDESSDEKAARVFAVSGVVGQEVVWQEAEKQWLYRTGGRVFHASKCESYEKDFELYKDLAEILGQSGLYGYGAALDLMAYKEIRGGMRPDLGYYACFSQVVCYLTDLAATAREPIEFTFDRREKSEHNAGALYGLLSRMPDWRANIFMKSKLSFDSRDNPRIQMADLFARETMKSMDNEFGPIRMPQRKSLQALCVGEGKRFRIDWIGRDFCEGLHQAAERARVDIRYAAWLSERKVEDNWSNLFAYMASHDASGNQALVLDPEKPA